MADTQPTLLRFTIAFALGLLLTGYAAHTAFWHAYMNPTIGTPATSAGSSIILLVMFLGGTGLAYWAFVRGIGTVVGDTAAS